MEKFGIFELLDTLAALTDSSAPAQSPPTEEVPEGKKMPDGAYRAPTYGQVTGANGNVQPPAEAQSGNAIDSFLARHERISRNAKK